MTAEAKRVVEVLGGTKVLGAKVRTFEDLKARIREGLPYGAVIALAKMIEDKGVKQETLSATLGLPAPRTLRRRKKPNRLEPGESDRLVRTARIIARAIELLGSREKAASWLDRPNRALGGEKPLSLLDTAIGAGQIEDILGRMEHGVIS
jgi:putative toxin-antitoxin system antitoxin component (TIGR02293 family)